MKTGSGAVPTKPTDGLIDLFVGRDSDVIDGIRGGGHDTFPQELPSPNTCSQLAQMNGQLTCHEERDLNATMPVDSDILIQEEAPQHVQVVEVQVHAENRIDETSGADVAPDVQHVPLDVQLVAYEVKPVAPDAKHVATVVQPFTPAQPQQKEANVLKEKAKDFSPRRPAKRRRNENCDSQLWNDYLQSEIGKNHSAIETNKAITALAKMATLWLTKNLGT